MKLVRLEDVRVEFPFFRNKSAASFMSKMLGSGSEKSKFLALQDITFELVKGDRVGVLGVNGSGKSTLLKVLARLLPPTSGEIAISGEIFPALTPAPGLMFKATCLQNIILQGLSYGLSGERLRDYVGKVSDFSELGDFLNSPLDSLSAGMRGRFSVSTLNYIEPQLLFMDEWIGAADKKVLERNRGLLYSLVEKSDVFVLASHRREIIENHCTKAILLHEGRVIYFGTVTDAYTELAAIL